MWLSKRENERDMLHTISGRRERDPDSQPTFNSLHTSVSGGGFQAGQLVTRARRLDSNDKKIMKRLGSRASSLKLLSDGTDMQAILCGTKCDEFHHTTHHEKRGIVKVGRFHRWVRNRSIALLLSSISGSSDDLQPRKAP